MDPLWSSRLPGILTSIYWCGCLWTSTHLRVITSAPSQVCVPTFYTGWQGITVSAEACITILGKRNRHYSGYLQINNQCIYSLSSFCFTLKSRQQVHRLAWRIHCYICLALFMDHSEQIWNYIQWSILDLTNSYCQLGLQENIRQFTWNNNVSEGGFKDYAC